MARSPRCLVPDLAGLASGDSLTLDADSSHHLGRVLRLRVGDALELVDGAGGLAPATWSGGGTVELAAAPTVAARPDRRLTLAVAPPRPSRLDWLVEKAAELGVARLVLLDTRHAARRIQPARVERLRRKAREALQQCRRLHVMALDGPVDLDGLLQATARDALWLAAPPEDGSAAAAVAPQVPGGDVLALVGPEGGFHPDEERSARAAGACSVGLGDGVLRVETAALALAAWHALTPHP